MDQFEWIGLKLEELSKYITKLAPWKQKVSCNSSKSDVWNRATSNSATGNIKTARD